MAFGHQFVDVQRSHRLRDFGAAGWPCGRHESLGIDGFVRRLGCCHCTRNRGASDEDEDKRPLLSLAAFREDYKDSTARSVWRII